MKIASIRQSGGVSKDSEMSGGIMRTIVVTEELKQRCAELYNEGLTIDDVANKLEIPRSTAYSALKRSNVHMRRKGSKGKRPAKHDFPARWVRTT